MLRDYLPVLLQIIVAVGFAASALIVSVLLGKAGRRTPIKDSPYECGMVPIGEARHFCDVFRHVWQELPHR